MREPGIYRKGTRTRFCFGQKGLMVYYTTPSRKNSMTAERIDIWDKWAKGTVYGKEGKSQ